MKNYIIHVSTDFEREKHIRKEIAKTTFDFTFINDGEFEWQNGFETRHQI
jgi:hypothetical protein